MTEMLGDLSPEAANGLVDYVARLYGRCLPLGGTVEMSADFSFGQPSKGWIQLYDRDTNLVKVWRGQPTNIEVGLNLYYLLVPGIITTIRLKRAYKDLIHGKR